MRVLGIVVLVVLLAANRLCAGEVYGSIMEGSKPVGAGVKVEINASGKLYTAETDKFGSYRMFVKEKGKCVLTIVVREQSVSVDLFSYERSTRYDWLLEVKDGKTTVRRK
jgi:hypothetical protein